MDQSTCLFSSKQIKDISDYTFITKYARYDHKKKRRETWDEAVDRVRDMHLFRYASKGIEDDINWAFEQVRQKVCLPSMRSMQFGGEAILVNDARMYNCSYSLADRQRFFSEAFWMMLSGCGVGFSVQKQHVKKLPDLIDYQSPDEKEVFTYTVADTVEGWADALDILLSTFFKNTPISGKEVFFDFSRIRRKGSWLKTSGGRAPGAKPLRVALKQIKKLLRCAVECNQKKLEPIQVYDIVMMASDAVLSGGVRRSATICLFSMDDVDMLKAKTFAETGKVLSNKRKDGTWLTDYGVAVNLKNEQGEEPVAGDEIKIYWFNIMPWRARSNNSVALLRSKATLGQFREIVESARLYGEPGFVFVNDLDHGTNPCFTGDMRLLTNTGYKTLKDLWHKGGELVYNRDKPLSDYGSLDIINSNGVVKSTNVYQTSKSETVYQITLQNGTCIKATGQHEFFVLNGKEKIKRKLYELKLGDYLPLLYTYRTKIKKIEYVGEEEVFCLTEPENNEICINGVLTSQCSEIGMNPIDPPTQKTGFQVCNLTEINGGFVKTKEDWQKAVRASTIIGTLQAGYSYLPYLTDTSRDIIRRERLLGVSITGWMENPELLLNEELQREMSVYAVEVNKEFAEKIGIEQAARVTCTKPSGSSSLILGTSSGIHPHHARYYFRRVQANNAENPLQFFKIYNPQAVEKSVWGVDDECITFCVEAPENSIVKNDLSAIDFLKKVKTTYENWVVPGTARQDSTPNLTHNVSNTVQVADDEWDEVAEFIYQNRYCFSGISLLPKKGDKIYSQAPMERVESEEDIEKWNSLVSSFSKVSWESFSELDDYTNFSEIVACAGGACNI